MSRILSYRGRLASDGQDTILLSTKKGEAGYRITKFEVMPASFSGDQIGIVTINSTAYTPVNTVDFSDTTLLATAIVRTGNLQLRSDEIIIFDNTTFNQDIFIGLKNLDGDIDVNYHIELEQIKLSEHEAMVTTIMNIRNG